MRSLLWKVFSRHKRMHMHSKRFIRLRQVTRIWKEALGACLDPAKYSLTSAREFEVTQILRDFGVTISYGITKLMI